MVNLKKQADLWDKSKGPLQNILYLVENGLIIFGSKSIKTGVFLGSLFGIGLEELGAFFDEMLNLNTLKDIELKGPRESARAFTMDLFDISDEELAKEAFLYSRDFNKFSNYKIENKLPLSLIREAGKGSAIKGLLKRKMRSGTYYSNKGFIGYVFGMITGIFGALWKIAKTILVGGLGVLALKGSDAIHENHEESTKIRELNYEDSDSFGISIKETSNPYRDKLEQDIQKALKN